MPANYYSPLATGVQPPWAWWGFLVLKITFSKFQVRPIPTIWFNRVHKGIHDHKPVAINFCNNYTWLKWLMLSTEQLILMKIILHQPFILQGFIHLVISFFFFSFYSFYFPTSNFLPIAWLSFSKFSPPCNISQCVKF